jgi:hypothetical protein
MLLQQSSEVGVVRAIVVVEEALGAAEEAPWGDGHLDLALLHTLCGRGEERLSGGGVSWRPILFPHIGDALDTTRRDTAEETGTGQREGEGW